jgi:Zn-dependent M32 family carboxypeptidase
MLSLISTEEFKISIQPDKVELLKKLSSDTTLNEKEKRMIFLTNKKINDDLNIPVDVYEKYSLLINQANST